MSTPMETQRTFGYHTSAEAGEPTGPEILTAKNAFEAATQCPAPTGPITWFRDAGAEGPLFSRPGGSRLKAVLQPRDYLLLPDHDVFDGVHDALDVIQFAIDRKVVLHIAADHAVLIPQIADLCMPIIKMVAAMAEREEGRS